MYGQDGLWKQHSKSGDRAKSEIVMGLNVCEEGQWLPHFHWQGLGMCRAPVSLCISNLLFTE